MNDIEKYDSPEEYYYHDWLNSLKENGFIKEIVTQESYTIIPAVFLPFAGKEKSVLRQVSYTPDFIIYWEEKAKDVFFFTIDSKISSFTNEKLKKHFAHRGEGNTYVSVVDVKGTFASRQNSTLITFPYIQKIMFDKLGIYVNKVTPLDKKKGLFMNTFTPPSYLLTPTGKQKKLSWKNVTIEEFLKTTNENS